MGIGTATRQASFEDAARFLGDALPAGSLYRLLADTGLALFPDDYFADLYAATTRGRPTVPARTVAVVMLLQAHEGLSDREACDRLAFDLRWKAAAGLTVDVGSFHPTVLVGVRTRLRASTRPRRLFDDVTVVARQAGLLRGRIRVLDSTPLLDAVATQDTVTQLRAAIRKLLATLARAGATELAGRVRAALRRDDDYASVGKPPCDWDDPAAREQLVDALVRDALAALATLHGQSLPAPVAEAAELLGLIAGQDVEAGGDGVFRIARRVAADRVLSTVDPQARHGHKSMARRFDGYKAHLGVDPADELITEVAVTAANVADREVVGQLLAEPASVEPSTQPTGQPVAEPARAVQPDSTEAASPEPVAEPLTVIGDSAYAAGATLAALTGAGHQVLAKVPPARNRLGLFTKDRFAIDLDAGTVRCPAEHSVPIRPARRGGGRAEFADRCASCPLRASCTTGRTGRVVAINRHERALQAGKAAQRDPGWQQTYRTTRPTVERKIAHFTRRPWGGRRARCRGIERIRTDVLARAGAINLARLAVLGLRWAPTGWAMP